MRHLLFAAACAPLLAQTSPPSPAQSQDPFFLKQEITVTGTRTETDASQSPVSAGAISSQEIRIRDIRMVDQALDTAPGVYANRGKGFQDTQTGVGMRGFAGRGAGQTRTLILLDGQPLNDAYTGTVNWATLPVDEVDRLEVVRGPFSSLYGGNAMGGVVQILTKPVDRRHVEIRGEYGSQDTFRYGARIADRLLDRIGLSVAYDRLQSGGYPTNLVASAGSVASGGTPVSGFIPTLTTAGAQTFLIGEAGNNWWKQQSWRARADYTAGRNTTFYLQYIRQANNYGYDAYRSYLRDADGSPFDNGAASILFQGVARRLTVTPSQFLPGDGGNRSNFVSMRMIRAAGGGLHYRLGAGWSQSPTAYFSTPAAGSSLAGGPGTISNRPGRSWFADGQAAWTPNTRHSLTFGGDLRQDSTQVTESSVPNYTRRQDGNVTTYTAGGKSYTQGEYLQHHWHVGERLLLVSGARHDWWRTYDGNNAAPGATLAADYAERAANNFSAKEALLFRAPGGFALRASVGNAYHNPTVYDLYRTWRSSTGAIFASNPALHPERLIAWETGVNRRWHEIEFDGVFYTNHIRNLIYRSTDLNVDPRGLYRPVVNAAAARTRGLEVSARMPINSWLFVRAAYNWTDAIITRNPAIPESVGKHVPQTPVHNPSAALFATRRRWSFSTTARSVSRVFATDGNTDQTKGVFGAYDPFFEMDATATLPIHRHVSWHVSADNVLGRRYFSYYPTPGRMVFTGLRIQL